MAAERSEERGQHADEVNAPGVGKAVLVALVAGGGLQLGGRLQDDIARAVGVVPAEIQQVLGHAQLCEMGQWSPQLRLPVHCQLHPAHGGMYCVSTKLSFCRLIW